MASKGATERVLRQIQGAVSVRRHLVRALPPGCPQGALGLLFMIDQSEDACASDLATRCHLALSVVSRHLAHLDAQGLIERVPHPSDGRSYLVRVSPAGTAVLAETTATVVALATSALTEWTDAELDLLADLLARFNSSIDAAPTPGRVPVPA